MTLAFLRALCLRYPLTAGTKIGPMTERAIRKMKEQDSGTTRN